ncbi:MAG: hypothetical protein U1F71_03985 [Verrucomicrobiaceae bacterium]
MKNDEVIVEAKMTRKAKAKRAQGGDLAMRFDIAGDLGIWARRIHVFS